MILVVMEGNMQKGFSEKTYKYLKSTLQDFILNIKGRAERLLETEVSKKTISLQPIAQTIFGATSLDDQELKTHRMGYMAQA